MTDESTKDELKKEHTKELGRATGEDEEEPQAGSSNPAEPDDRDDQLDTAFERLEKRKIKEEAEPASSITGILAMLLALVAIGIGSFAVYTLYQPRDNNPLEALAAEMSSNLAVTQMTLQGNADELALLTGRLGSMEGRQLEALARFKSNFESRIADLQATTGTRSQDWIIAEVEYLLRMGNQAVLMERDPEGALALFKAADSIVADTEGLTAFSLRQAMAADIASLESVRMIDTEGIYLRLSAFAGQVTELRQAEHNYSPPEAATDFPITSETTFFNRLWNFALKASRRIASLVDFRRDQVRIMPILPPSEEYFLQQNLILKLQVAQIALLKSNQEIYSTSLKESITWIARYYDPEDTVTMSINGGLEALLAIDIQTEMPDVTASLRAVRELLSAFHQSEPAP